MTPQDAIEAIRLKDIHIESGAIRIAAFFQGLSVAKEALEKRIPKKPEPFERTAHDFQSDVCKHSHYPCEYIKPFNHEYKYTDYKCPVCGKLTKDGTPRFCWCCGQALDWSDTE